MACIKFLSEPVKLFAQITKIAPVLSDDPPFSQAFRMWNPSIMNIIHVNIHVPMNTIHVRAIQNIRIC